MSFIHLVFIALVKACHLTPLLGHLNPLANTLKLEDHPTWPGAPEDQEVADQNPAVEEEQLQEIAVPGQHCQAC